MTKDSVNDQVFYSNKIFLEGNADLLTRYFQTLTSTAYLKVAYFGDNPIDAQAVHEYNQRIVDGTGAARWSSFPVINELS